MKRAGETVFIAALGMMATLMSVEIRDLMEWNDMFTPSFIGTLMAHFGTVVGAYVAGRLTPENRTGKTTRSGDTIYPRSSKVDVNKNEMFGP